MAGGITSSAAIGVRCAVAVSALAVIAAWVVYPGGAEGRPGCGGRKATIVRGGGDNTINVPKHGVQVIVAGGGNDRIIAKRNRDIVCAGPGDDYVSAGTGRDKVFGGAGNDLIDGGPGSDTLFGDADVDTILGGPGGESSHGGLGDDRLFGEIQDDDLSGDAGSDLLVGGHGIDRIDGGSEDDWIRGDVNRDNYNGGDGIDTLSFATATPPGPLLTQDGVTVNLPVGSAAGDDSQETVGGIENVIGSPFADRITGAGGGSVRGNGGVDFCTGFATTSCGRGDQASGGPVAYLADPGSPDPGLVVFGGAGSETWSVSNGGGALTVTGSPIRAGAGCSSPAGPSPSGNVTPPSGTVTCAAPARELGYILLWGDAGSDSLTVGAGFSPTTLAKGDGGPGDDSLNGGPAADLFFPGETGADQLFGAGGDDALIGRPGGADLLSGGPGTDQLVSDDPCAGHTYDGGPGLSDVAGFGHVSSGGVQATLGGTAILRGAGACTATRVLGSNEILEGTPGDDLLVGDNRPNLIIGREGNDLLIGRGGKDELRGDAGFDRCVPGAGGALRLSC